MLVLVLVLVLDPSRVEAQPPDRLAPIAELVRRHHDEEALAALDALPAATRGEPRARYLRGRLLERLGRTADAADALVLAAGDLPPEVTDDARRRRARLLVLADRCADARPLLEGDPLLRALGGQCALAAGDLAAAVTALRAAAREDAPPVDTFAVRLLLAEALHRQGDAAAARTELRALLVARPEHPDASRAEEQLLAIGGAADFSAEERRLRAERLAEAGRHRDAVAELDRAGRPRDRTALRAWLHLRGMSLFRTRGDYPEAARDLAAAARLRGPDEVEDAFHAARALARADQDSEAIAAFRRVARRFATHPRAAEAEFLAAWLELRLGRRSGAAAMARFLRGPRGRSGPFAVRARWELGFHALEAGRAAEAATELSAYTAAVPRGEVMARLRGEYWQARALLAAGDRTRAIAKLRSVVHAEPLHWYALLARERLIALGQEPGPPWPPPAPESEAAPLPPPRLPPAAAVYASLGLREEAVALLRAHERDLRNAAPRGRGLEALAAAYRTLDEPSRPYRLVATAEQAALSRAPTAGTRWIWEAAYPRPWPAEVTAAAEANGLPPEHLYAIMRQESGYDRDAVSYAEAIGLLQLLPQTAAEIGRRVGLAVDRETLFEPEANIRLGAVYLAALHRRFGERLPLGIAAYNAGVPAVRRWLAASGEIELDRFVERIPIDQTRDYVRRVVTHYARYRALADPARRWPFRLPATVGP